MVFRIFLVALVIESVLSATSLFVHPDSPFTVKRIPGGEILVRKRSTSKPRSSLNNNLEDYLSAESSSNPFFTFSSSSSSSLFPNRKPYEVITLKPYKNILSESRTKWPLYTLESYLNKKSMTSTTTTTKNPISKLSEPIIEDDLYKPYRTQIFDDKEKSSVLPPVPHLKTMLDDLKTKEDERVIVKKPDLLTISTFLPGPVIVQNQQSMKTISSTTPSTTPNTIPTIKYSLMDFLRDSTLAATTTTIPSTTTTALSTTLAPSESSQFGLSSLFNMISYQVKYLSDNFLKNKRSEILTEEVETQTTTNRVIDSAALLPALVGGVLGVGYVVSELSKSSSKRRISRKDYARPKSVNLGKRRPLPRRTPPSTSSNRIPGITQFVAADARPRPALYGGGFYYDYFKSYSDSFVNTNDEKKKKKISKKKRKFFF